MPTTLETVGVLRPTNALPNGFAEAHGRLASFSALQANWDGYGAGPIPPAILSAVRAFLDRLAQMSSPPVPRDSTFPAVVPLSSGAVQLEWHVGERILELEFETAEVIHFLKWWPQKGVAVEGTYFANDLSRSVTLLDWVLCGHDSA